MVFGFIGGIIMAFKRQVPQTIVIPLMMAVIWLFMWWQTGDFGYLVPPFSAFIAAFVVSSLLPFSFAVSSVVTVLCSLVLLFSPYNITRLP